MFLLKRLSDTQSAQYPRTFLSPWATDDLRMRLNNYLSLEFSFKGTGPELLIHNLCFINCPGRLSVGLVFGLGHMDDNYCHLYILLGVTSDRKVVATWNYFLSDGFCGLCVEWYHPRVYDVGNWMKRYAERGVLLTFAKEVDEAWKYGVSVSKDSSQHISSLQLLLFQRYNRVIRMITSCVLGLTHFPSEFW